TSGIWLTVSNPCLLLHCLAICFTLVPDNRIMICETMSSISLMPAERNVPMRQPMFPHRHQTLGLGDSLVIRTNQRLPPISDLLKDVPLPLSRLSSQPLSREQPYPAIHPQTFPPPISC